LHRGRSSLMPRMGVVLALTVISTGPCLATLLWSFTSLAIDVELRAAAVHGKSYRAFEAFAVVGVSLAELAGAPSHFPSREPRDASEADARGASTAGLLTPFEAHNAETTRLTTPSADTRVPS